MRRISLAMALLGAVAAAGCSGGSKPSSDSTSKGTPGSTFTLQIRGEAYNYIDPVTNASVAVPVGGTITSVPAGINCGDGNYACRADFAWGTPVVLTASTTPMAFHAFAGACSGNADTCTIDGNADTFVLVRFAATATALGSHPNFSDPAVHGLEYMKLLQGQAAAYGCATTACHGTGLTGAGIAPSCYQCHGLPTGVVAAGTGGHFDATAVPWTDHTTGWSQACQRCHTSEGFRDYVGVDGSPNYLGTTYNGTATATTPPGGAGYANGPLKCWTCHNAVSSPAGVGLTTIQFPRPTTITTTTQSITYVKVTTDNVTALCSQCHQGRESTDSVNQKIGNKGADVVLTGTSFVNPHYLGAAATVFGSEAKMWVEYAGKIYTGRNTHGVLEGKCTSCHDAHTLDVKVTAQTCGRCHFDEVTGTPVTSFAQLEESRQFGFEGDIDGDGAQESLKAEIDGLSSQLYASLQEYATSVAKKSIVYDGLAYPYYFVDTNGNGQHDGYDANGAMIDPALAESTQYKSFTPRSLRAAVNYKWTQAEPGAWAHNPRYVVEILYDAIVDLKTGTFGNADAFKAVARRSFNGHFGGATKGYSTFLYSSGSGFTSAACYQCHGGQGGVAAYLASAPAALGNSVMTNKVTGMQCTTCHAPQTGDVAFDRIRSDIATVYVPPQKGATQTPTANVVTFAASTLPTNFALCATCHSARENGTSVDNSITANYALSATGLVAVDPTGTASIAVASTGWAKDRYLNAKLTFTSGANAGTTLIVKSSTATTGGKSALNFKTAAPNAVASGDTFDLTFDATTWGIGFTNPHYLGAAGLMLGSHAGVLYQYPGQTYQGFPVFWKTSQAGNAPGPHGSPHGATCTWCHDPKASKHTFEAALTPAGSASGCGSCHKPSTYGDYSLEPKKLEQEEAANELYAAIKTYATGKGFTICYNGASHPYWFADDDSDGVCATTVQAKLDAKAAKAAFNFKWAHAEPGAYAHNEQYILQGLYDAIVDLGGTPTFVRPAVVPDAQ